jgi:hypothetical protein
MDLIEGLAPSDVTGGSGGLPLGNEGASRRAKSVDLESATGVGRVFSVLVSDYRRRLKRAEFHSPVDPRQATGCLAGGVIAGARQRSAVKSPG